VFTVVDHHVFVWVEADHKFTGTATTGFFDAPDPEIVGHVVFGLGLPCTHKSEITDESKFEHSALPHPSPPLIKGREPVHILPPFIRGD
jgi:hypothetical protein